MIRKYQGKTKFIYLPWTIGQVVEEGGLVGLTSGQLIPHVAGTAGAAAVGVIRHAVTSATDVYTTQGDVEVEVPVEKNVIWECDVDATAVLVLLDIGSFFDLSSVSGTLSSAVDTSQSDEDVFQCVGFISATKGLFLLNIGLGADTETDLGA